MGSEFWYNMAGMRDAAISAGTINGSDLKLYALTDDVEEALRLLSAAKK